MLSNQAIRRKNGSWMLVHRVEIAEKGINIDVDRQAGFAEYFKITNKKEGIVATIADGGSCHISRGQ